MTLICICLGVLAWLGLGLLLVVKTGAGLSVPAATKRLANLIPPLVVFTLIPLFICLPVAGNVPPPSIIVRAIHYFGIVLLFLFLLFGAYCLFEAWGRMWARDRGLGPLAATYRKWWVATRLLPAPAAICILASGLRLAYESPLGSVSLGWMFWLITGFSFFFFDGLLFYLPEICFQNKAIHQALERGETLEEYRRKYRRPGREWMLLAHSVSFPFVFALGCAKPEALWRPEVIVDWLQHLFPGGPGTPQFAQAAVLVLIVGVGLLVVRIRKLVAYGGFLYSNSTDGRLEV